MEELLYQHSPKRVLIITAVERERDSVIHGIDRGRSGSGCEFTIISGGVGPVAASASTMKAIMEHGHFDIIINMGIAGGFGVQNGSVVFADRIIFADLGVEDKQGFVPMPTLGFGKNTLKTASYWHDLIVARLSKLDVVIHEGTVLTVSTVTGTEESANKLKSLYPLAIAEEMEGFGVAFAADLMGIPMLGIRSISNQVGPRDRDSWEIDLAMSCLTVVGQSIAEVMR